MFADTEGGLDSLSVYKTAINNWTDFLLLCKEFTEADHPFKSMCIDTVDNLSKMCINYMMQKNDIIHPSDLDWGKGWSLVHDEFARPFMKLALSEYGLILISHVNYIEIKTRISKFTKAVPSIQNYLSKIIENTASIIMYFTSIETDNGEERQIKISPSENYIAGDRTKRLLKHDPIIIKENVNNWKMIEELWGT